MKDFDGEVLSCDELTVIYDLVQALKGDDQEKIGKAYAESRFQ